MREYSNPYSSKQVITTITKTYKEHNKITSRIFPFEHYITPTRNRTRIRHNYNLFVRWNFAHERFYNLMENGYTYEQALAQVSKELGHERADITKHYLR